MDPQWKFDVPNFNGMKRQLGDALADKKARRNYKLVLDPVLKQGAGPDKIYRFDGVLPGDPTPVIVRDPRSRMKRYWSKREAANLAVPKFTYDHYYVGTPLPKEVTFTNLNDNINTTFLEDMCKGFGTIEEVQIFYHPKTKKHIGVGKILFTSTRGARACAEKLNNTSKMGKIMNVFVDTMGQERQKILDDMTAEKPTRPPSPETPRRRSDPRGNYDHHEGKTPIHRQDDHSRTHCRESNFPPNRDNFVPTPQSTSDLGYASGLSDVGYSDAGYSVGQSEISFGSQSEVGSFVSTPQTPHTPHTPQIGFGENTYGHNQYGMQQNMGYNMNMGNMPLNQNLPAAMPHPPPMPPTQAMPPPQAGMAQGYGNQYGMPKHGGCDMPPMMHQQQQPLPPQGRNQHQNSGYGHFSNQSFHRKDRDRERDRDRHRDHDDWRRDRDRDRDRRDRNRDRRRDRNRDREDRDHGGRNHDVEHTFKSPPAPRVPSPEPERPRNQSLESRIELLLRQTREEPVLSGMFGSPEDSHSSHGSSGSSSHGRREEYYEPPPPRPSEVAPPPLPPETPPPLPPTMEMPPLPAREDLPPLPPLPPDMEADAEAFSLYGLPHAPTNSQPEAPPVLPDPACDTAPSPATRAHEGLETSTKLLENAHPAVTDNHDSEQPTDKSCTAVDDKDNEGKVQSQGMSLSPSAAPYPTGEAGVTNHDGDDMMVDEKVEDDDDDDRMSLSSISSGEQKLEVNVPQPEKQPSFSSAQDSTYVDITQPPPVYWSSLHQQQNFQNNFDGSFNSFGGQYGQPYNVSPMKQPILLSHTPNDELQEKAFLGVLEQVIDEMKDILQKDLCKRMVQNCAFKCYEVWWDREQNRGKRNMLPPRKPPFGTDRPPVKNSRGWSSRNNHAPPPPSSTSLSASSSQPTKADASSTISALFESKDGGFGTNFGMGGLLGLRGGIPKLPSFRRKKFRPPSPPPEEEYSQDQDVITETEIRRPHTPSEEWDEEEGRDKSDVEDVEGASKLKAGRRIIEDSEESDKSESESEKAESEEEEEEEEVSGASSEEEDEESDEASSEDEEEGSSSSSGEEEEEEEEIEAKADVTTERVKSLVEASDADTTQSIDVLPKPAEEEKPTSPIAEKAAAGSEVEKAVDVEPLQKEAEAVLEEEKDTEEEMEHEDAEEEQDTKPEEKPDKVKDKPDVEETSTEMPAPGTDVEAVQEMKEEEDEDALISVVDEEDSETPTVEPVEVPTAEPVEAEDTKMEEAAGVAVAMAAEPPRKKVERTTSIDALTDKERSAFNMLMEMQLRPQELTVRTSRERHPSAPESHTLLKDLIARPPLVSPAAEEIVSPQLEPGLEQDAVLALLQMHDEPLRTASTKTEVVVQEVVEPKPEEVVVSQEGEEERKMAQYAMATEHNYFARQPTVPSGMKEEGFDSDVTDSASEGEPIHVATLPAEIQRDHNYCVVYYPEEKSSPKKQRPVVEQEPVVAPEIPEVLLPEPVEVEVKEEITVTYDENLPEVSEVKDKEEKVKPPKKKKDRKKDKKLKDLTNLTQADILLPPKKEKPTFKTRSLQIEMQVTYDFLIRGIDPEDINYLKRRYDELLQDDSPSTYWLNDMHWVDHAQTLLLDPPPPKKKRKHSTTEEFTKRHKTGCARTEGYYKIEFVDKLRYLQSSQGVQPEDSQLEGDQRQTELTDKVKKKMQQTREARSETRRIQNVLSSLGEDVSDIFKFNQLKFRKKHLKFAKSGIHAWGLFALEPIAAEEMVIEYVGQVVRHSVANIREKNYEACGIGSSYLFRVDSENVIDATKCGNLARFINHSCNPNCYAKIITVESRRKIVIYSKRDISVNDEITYDYKFPIEEEKITCLCGAPNCRGTLN